MVDHGQTMVIPLPDHGRPWLQTMINHGKTIVDHGLTMILTPGFISVIIVNILLYIFVLGFTFRLNMSVAVRLLLLNFVDEIDSRFLSMFLTHDYHNTIFNISANNSSSNL